MTAVVLRPRPLPLDRVQPNVGLLVLAFHVGLLWLAALYWPIQNVLFAAAQDTVQIIAVQIFQKTTERSRIPVQNESDSRSNPQAISSPGLQRFGRAETMLALPAAQTESSTPLAATAQTARTAPARSLANNGAARAAGATAITTAPALTTPTATAAAAPFEPATLPKEVLQAVPSLKATQLATPRKTEDALPAAATAPAQLPAPTDTAAATATATAAAQAPTQALPPAPLSLIPSPPSPLSPPVATAPLATPPSTPPSIPTPALATPAPASPAFANSLQTPATPAATAPSSSSTPSAAIAPTAGFGVGSALQGVGAGGSNPAVPTASGGISGNIGGTFDGAKGGGAPTGAPLNLTLPPRSVYRPPDRKSVV